MLSATTYSTAATAFRVVFHFLTLVAAYGWLKFADVRSHCLDRPSVHHRVYLRLLIFTSMTAIVSFLLSVICTFGARCP